MKNKTRTFKVIFHTSPDDVETRCRVTTGPDAEERALTRAVEKLFGKRCWFNVQASDRAGGGSGQIFCGSRARTDRICVRVVEV